PDCSSAHPSGAAPRRVARCRRPRSGPMSSRTRPAPGLGSLAVADAAHTHHSHSAFGEDTFGRFAEHAARFLGTPQYIVGQTIVVAIWIVMNGVFLVHPFDVYPFVLLNLVFSTQAAYAAPLILLAQTRQADRDKLMADKVNERHTKL